MSILRKKRIKCSPELADGQHWTVWDTPEEVAHVVAEWVKHQLEYGSTGESCTLEVVKMTDKQVSALPDL